jgi:predicted Zn-ribbon and HTH transcriptional regulator
VALRKQRKAKLHCNNCGHEWEGLAWHVSIGSSDQNVIGWNIDSGNAARGNECPECKSELIGAHLLRHS